MQILSTEGIVRCDPDQAETAISGCDPHIQTLESRLQRYGKRKRHTEEMAAGLAVLGTKESAKLAAKLIDCGNFLRFRDYYTIERVRLVGACFCKQHLVCELCAVRRAAKLLEHNLPRFEFFLNSQNAKRFAHLIVVTVKSGFDLVERHNHLDKSLQKWRKRATTPTKYPGTFFEWVDGGVMSFETTYNPEHGWHPHCNVLCISEVDRFDIKKPKAEWLQITGDSSYIWFSDDSHTLAATLAETIKYVTKAHDLEPELIMEMVNALRGRRLVRGFGCMYNLKIPSDLTDSPLPADLPYIEYVCRYLGPAGYTIYSVLESAAGASEPQASVPHTTEPERTTLDFMRRHTLGECDQPCCRPPTNEV